ncbi:hypothetical protein GCM10025791_21740 [Halioxenophilus aromaticivorans]|uniref:Uncharacterized protein n=1 Tax=Halioxenophilus aromaticivorans TaxID=1306992 RepID=A0AAV3U2D3_9ALTE
MPCSPISGFRLDSESRAALQRINDNKKITKYLGTALSLGVFNSIFTKSEPPVAAFNITQTDWELYSKAMNALPSIQKKAIQKEIDLMIIHYQMGKYDHQHVQFWQGMKHACK